MSMPTFAVLLDGGFVKRKLGSADSPFGADAASALCAWLKAHPLLADFRLHRIYFYDAKPLEGSKKKPLGGGSYNFTAHPTLALNKKLHEEIVRQPDPASFPRTPVYAAMRLFSAATGV
ncbi:MAG: hypothetical protein WBD51_05945 [Burkholderiaceae bacterium]